MAKGYSLNKGFLFLVDWEQALRALPANDFHALFWELYDFQQSKGDKKVPQHPQNPLLDMLSSLLVPQIQNRLNGARGGDIANGNTNDGLDTVGGMVGGSLHKLSKDKISQVEMSGTKVSGAEIHQEPPSTAPPLSEEERQELLTKGFSETYIDERLQRAAVYASQHQKTVFDVLCTWWKEDKNKHSNHERTTKTGDLGNSFDTDDFFQAALRRSFKETGVTE